MLGLATSTMAQTTWVVDSTGAGQFTSIEAAYDAAAPGDTVVVRAGVYGGFTRQAKGIRLLAARPAPGQTFVPVSLYGTLQLSNLPPGQQLWFEGFGIAILTILSSSTNGLVLTNCPDVVLASVTLTGGQPPYGMPPGEGLQLHNTTCLMSHVTVTGGRGYFAAFRDFPGGVGLRATSSRVSLANCSIRSGDNGGGVHGARNADALVAQSSAIVLDECLVQPGLTGPVPVTPPRSLFVDSSRVLVGDRSHQILAPVMLSGMGSIEYDGALTAIPGSLPLTPRSQPSLSGPGSVLPGNTIQWGVAGAPGSVGVAAMSLGSLPLALPGLFDSMLFTAAHPSASLSSPFVVPASGSATLSLPVPTAPQLVGEHVLMQAAGWLGQPTLKATGVVVTVIL